MATLLRRCMAALRAPGNELAFAVRSGLGWQRGPADLVNEEKAGLFAPGASTRVRRLVARFDLGDLERRSTIAAWAGNLALLENLEALTRGIAIPRTASGAVRAIDVGSGDFHYATALQRWLSRHGEPAEPRAVVLRGFEIDGHGIYRDGHSRADHARSHAALAARPGDVVRYEVADAASVRLPEQDVVTMLFPFLTAYPALRWGMPLSRWRPRRLVRRVVRSLRPGGLLVVVNQTADELERLRRLLADEPLEWLATASFATDLGPSAERTADRVGSVWCRLEPRTAPPGRAARG
ncbi:MAG: hypothetical protein JNK78_05810 [Planctomycetes bacterium]|nr:hypothetical protein [Planctomycetota bacterium]